MVTILMMPAKMATLGLLKMKVFEIKVMTSLTKFNHVIQIIS